MKSPSPVIILRPNNHRRQRAFSSKIRTKRSGKFLLAILQWLIRLLLLTAFLTSVLIPIYGRLLIVDTSTPDAIHQPQRKPTKRRRSEPSRPPPPPPPPPPPIPRRPDVNSKGDGGAPFVGADIFERRYSRYGGRLPSPRGRAAPDPACGGRPEFSDFFLLPKTERSRFNEDKKIYNLFKNLTIPSSPVEESPLPRGTYVELGAFDGKEESNTMFFDKCLGWDGLLIEAQSQSYQRAIENRPNAVKLSFSPTCRTGGGTARLHDYPLSNNGVEGLARSYAGRGTVEVPCGPLTPVLRDVFGPEGSVSFFSLDVEGAELLVLETLDLGALSIEVMMVEIRNSYCREGNCPSVVNIRNRMAATGKYALFDDFVEASDVYVRLGTNAWRRAIDLRHERKEREERMMRGQTILEQLWWSSR